MIGLSLDREHRRYVSGMERIARRAGDPAVFGALSPVQWIRFGRIHQEHHEKIVGDILDVA